jgi:hypothetical protein
MHVLYTAAEPADLACHSLAILLLMLCKLPGSLCACVVLQAGQDSHVLLFLRALQHKQTEGSRVKSG